MKGTWSDPNKKWDGFRPVKYCLDFRALALPVTKTSSASQEVVSTVGEIVRSLPVEKATLEDKGFQVEIAVDSEKLLVSGPSFNLWHFETIAHL